MSWFDWFRTKGGQSPDGDAPLAAMPPKKVSGTAASRRGRQSGDSYAQEWLRVLGDAAPGRDPFNTYTWELDANGARPARTAGAAVQPPVVDVPAPAPAAPAEANEGFEADPWGLGESARHKARVGVNPYDTGVFRGGWGERSKAR
jgi:hypothetical protein